MRAVISTIVIASAALLASACTSNETTNVTNTTEVVPVENTATDTMVTTTNIDAGAPVGNVADTMSTDTTTANTTGNAM